MKRLKDTIVMVLLVLLIGLCYPFSYKAGIKVDNHGLLRAVSAFTWTLVILIIYLIGELICILG